MNIVSILLAAGSAKRFGSDKLLHALPHDVPIAVQAARQLRAAIDGKVLVVTRAGAEPLADLLRSEGCTVVPCKDAGEGMGASLACGARAAGPADAYLVALGDMPFIRTSTIAAVRDALAGGAVLAAPYFRARRGHPVGFSGRFRTELESLQGDQGAKELLARHTGDLTKVPVGDPGAIRDIDTPGDLTPPLVV